VRPVRNELRKSKPNSYSGKEIFEIKPIILGGSPTDPANKMALSRADHIKAVRYWNKIIRDLRKQAPNPAKDRPG